MSLQIIRRALEKKLAALTPAISIAYENAPFTPAAGTPYCRVNLLPNTPDNSTMGSAMFIERGLFQVMLCYPLGVGPATAEAQAQLVRAHYKRGTSMLESGLTVLVTNTPRIAPSTVDGDRYCIPITVPWQCQIST